MDITDLSMNMSQAKLLNSVGTAMLSKSFDMAEAVGDSVTELVDSAAMERSVCPELGANIDISV
ncbi:MAG: YjfB family protein [Lachnospiraceae bacterium]|nr:YjfB family protein [Lachnospiraceae bacterium]